MILAIAPKHRRDLRPLVHSDYPTLAKCVRRAGVCDHPSYCPKHSPEAYPVNFSSHRGSVTASPAHRGALTEADRTDPETGEYSPNCGFWYQIQADLGGRHSAGRSTADLS